MDEEAYNAFVERIYDWALDPRLWSELLAQMAGVLGGHAASIEQEYADSGLGAGLTVGLDASIVENYFSYYAGLNVLRRVDGFAEKIRRFTPVVTVDEETMSKSELQRTEFYADFLRPAGIHSVLTIGLWGGGDQVTALGVFRRRGRASFDAERDLAQALHPHLVRAFRLGRKAAEGRWLAMGLTAGLERSPFAVLLLAPDGQVRHANQAAERLLAQPGGLSVMAGRLVAYDAADGERLRATLARALAADGRRSGGGVSIRRPGGRSPLSVSATPFGELTGRDIRAERGAIVCVTDPDAGIAAPEAYLCGVLGLTRAEAGVARALVAGKSVQAIAEELALSKNTIRVHLSNIFGKTGTTRQAELVAHIARAAS